ncbi:hypothetical protein FISHEDRAFT_73097 [Fistulina hepatica ATCC 64428]|uniref:Ribonuclease H1 N-terminal domain-containing protein n=1 Tax=Fistulina hepatica ATCC 64428 TaxID=1128425 RepID=A0A0D7ADM4_9AGAR|nr:hypothetical protein FISHEDRAFT_73097 [Fistulina hepatica ATCC 64428]
MGTMMVIHVGGPHPLTDEDFLLLTPPYTITDALALLADPRYADVDGVGRIGLDDAASINHGTHPHRVAVILNSLPPNEEGTTFYVVTVGRCPGVYNSWPLAGPLVIGVPAVYCVMKRKEIALCMYMNAWANGKVLSLSPSPKIAEKSHRDDLLQKSRLRRQQLKAADGAGNMQKRNNAPYLQRFKKLVTDKLNQPSALSPDADDNAEDVPPLLSGPLDYLTNDDDEPQVYNTRELMQAVHLRVDRWERLAGGIGEWRRLGARLRAGGLPNYAHLYGADQVCDEGKAILLQLKYLWTDVDEPPTLEAFQVLWAQALQAVYRVNEGMKLLQTYW